MNDLSSVSLPENNQEKTISDSQPSLDDLKKNISLLLVANSIGLNLKGGMNKCPFHNDNNPSCNIDIKKNLWHCFGCNKGGSAIELIKYHNKCDDKTAIKTLYEIAGVSIKRKYEKKEAHTTAADAIAETKFDIKKKQLRNKLNTIQKGINNGIPPIQWCIKNILTSNGITIIASPPKQYKTFFAIYAALCVSTGNKVLDAFETTLSTVLYLDEENGERTLLRRFKQIANGENIIIPDNIHYISFGLLKLDTDEGAKLLDWLIQDAKPGLVILDSMTRFLEGDEDSSSDVRKIFETLKKMLDQYPVCFLILHHTRKGNGRNKIKLDDLRGSSDFGAFADAILNLENAKQGFEFRMLANRHIGLQEVKPTYIEIISDRQQGPITFANRGIEPSRMEIAKSALIEWLRRNKKMDFCTKDALEYLGTKDISKQAYYEALESLKFVGSISEVKSGKYNVTPGTIVVIEEDVP